MRRIIALLAAALAVCAVAVAAQARPALALDDGLALTPPMGWNDWNAFGCNVSAQLVEQTAAAMAADGMKADGDRAVVLFNSTEPNVVNVFEQSVPLATGKQIVAVTLPDTSSGVVSGSPSLHVFAMAIGG